MDPNSPIHQEKKSVLQHLVRHALGASAGKHIQDVITALKTAVAGYKNYAREYDNLHGLSQPKPAAQKPAAPQGPWYPSAPGPQQ